MDIAEEPKECFLTLFDKTLPFSFTAPEENVYSQCTRDNCIYFYDLENDIAVSRIECYLSVTSSDDGPGVRLFGVDAEGNIVLDLLPNSYNYIYYTSPSVALRYVYIFSIIDYETTALQNNGAYYPTVRRMYRYDSSTSSWGSININKSFKVDQHFNDDVWVDFLELTEGKRPETSSTIV